LEAFRQAFLFSPIFLSKLAFQLINQKNEKLSDRNKVGRNLLRHLFTLDVF